MTGVWTVAALVLLTGARAPEPFAYAVDVLEKVRPGALPKGTDRIALQLARNECEGAQIVVPPGPRQVRIEVVAPGAGKRSALIARVYREEFLTLQTPSNASGGTGPWPDPLIPAKDVHAHEGRRAFPADSLPERPVVAYVEVCTRAADAPGLYEGKVRVTAHGERPVELPLSARVHAVTLPATSSLPNSFGLSLYSMSRGHGLDPASGDARALLGRYVDTLLAHRLTPQGLEMSGPPARAEGDRVRVDFDGFDALWGRYLEGKETPAGARFTSVQLHDAPRGFTDAQRTAYYAAVRDHFKDRGWSARLFFYAKDEPKPADFPLVRAQAEKVNRAGGIPVLITSGLEPELKDSAGILCPVLNCFFPRAGPETCKQAMPIGKVRAALSAGAQVWWYQSCLSHGCNGGPIPDASIERVYNGWASYMIDHPAPLNRAMGPLAFLVGVDGELYFDTVFAYNRKDPWKDVFEFGGNGDGTLFYPGTPARIGGDSHIPVESLRLKHIRDGLEDYELLRRLALSGGEPRARRAVAKLVRSGYEVTTEPTVWAKVRAELFEALDEYPGAPPVGKDR